MRYTMQMRYLFVTDLRFKNVIYSLHLSSFETCYCKKQIDISFLCVCRIIEDKFAVEPLACGSWFHSHFDNVMMQFIINKRTNA